MKIKISPLLKRPTQYGVDQKEFRRMLNAKKTAQSYDKNGQKKFRISNGQKKWHKGRPVILKHDRLEGPLAVAMFMTEDIDPNVMDLEHPIASYVYQGVVVLEKDDYMYVYRDSLTQGYTEAMFSDDNTMLFDIRNRVTKEKKAAAIGGEPTSVECWDFNVGGNDDATHSRKKLIEDKLDAIAKEYNIPREKVYGVIQLNCNV